MVSWMSLTPCEVTQQLFSQKQNQVYQLLHALNQSNQKTTNLATLLQSIAATVCKTLDPIGCVIWLCEEATAGDEPASPWVGARPPPGLADADEACPLQAGVLPVVELKNTILRTALLEAGMRLATPMLYQGEVMGWLGIGAPRQGRSYPPEKCWFLEVLAYQTALAIYSLRLKTRLEASIMQLRGAYQQVIQAQENERRELAAMLHDETLQHLADLAVRVGLLRNQNEIQDADLDDLQTRLANADRRLREIVRGMHPAILSDLGLIEAVIAFLESLPAHHAQAAVRIELWVTGFKAERLPDQHLELALYRFMQNAMTNALTHGKPGRIRVEFNWGVDMVKVQIQDNGCGMEAAVEKAARAGHFGLLTMRERIEACGGWFGSSSKPGQGTQVTGYIPLTVPSPAPGQTEQYVFELS